MEKLSHIMVILVAFLATLAAFTALQIQGSEGTEALRDILLTLAGILGGVAVPRLAVRDAPPTPSPEPPAK